MRLTGTAIAAAVAATLAACASAQDGIETLKLEQSITLPDVSGRIDHLAINPDHTRLAVAELANNSIDVLDIASGKAIHRIPVREPQGLAFDQTGKIFLTASRADGNLYVFDAGSFERVATIELGDDADNVRIDPRNGNAVVGYGHGALARVDLTTRAVILRIELGAHPESFQIDPATGHAYVNLPDTRTIAVADLDTGEVSDRWKLPLALWNYPLALSSASDQLVSIFRAPAQLVQFDRTSGAQTGSVSTCGDADDVFYDAKRERIYVACGDGGVDVLDISRTQPKWISRVPTPPGSRTAFFDPVLDRLFVASRSPAGGKPAAILIFKPVD